MGLPRRRLFQSPKGSFAMTQTVETSLRATRRGAKQSAHGGAGILIRLKSLGSTSQEGVASVAKKAPSQRRTHGTPEKEIASVAKKAPSQRRRGLKRLCERHVVERSNLLMVVEDFYLKYKIEVVIIKKEIASVAKKAPSQRRNHCTSREGDCFSRRKAPSQRRRPLKRLCDRHAGERSNLLMVVEDFYLKYKIEVVITKKEIASVAERLLRKDVLMTPEERIASVALIAPSHRRLNV